jgi:uncharacterized Zn finger protein
VSKYIFCFNRVYKMQEISFQVQGSALKPYAVVFIRGSNTNLSAFCTCPAGENGQCCKHRLAIFAGIQTNIVSSNVSDVTIVQSWLAGTDIEQALIEVNKLESETIKIKKALLVAKKKLAKTMRE